MPPVITSEQIVPDIVAFSGQRKYSELAAGHNNTELRDAYIENLLAAGWEQLSANSVRSQQSPWYDIDNVPAWYAGNKIVLTFDVSDSRWLDVRVGADYLGSTEFLMTTPQRFRTVLSAVNGFGRFMLGSPYQFITWTDANPDLTASKEDLGDMIISALNIPKAVFQRQKVVHCICATNRFRGSSTLTTSGPGAEYFIYRTKDDSGSTFFGQRTMHALIPVGGASVGSEIGRRIWNRAANIAMDDPDEWSAFFSPPYICYRLPGGSIATINGFLWDSLVLTEGFQLKTKITQTEREWVCYSGMHNSSVVKDATLFVCITEVGLDDAT